MACSVLACLELLTLEAPITKDHSLIAIAHNNGQPDPAFVSEPTRRIVGPVNLRYKGYIWRQRDQTLWEPGIPSPMDFMTEQTEIKQEIRFCLMQQDSTEEGSTL